MDKALSKETKIKRLKESPHRIRVRRKDLFATFNCEVCGKTIEIAETYIERSHYFAHVDCV